MPRPQHLVPDRRRYFARGRSSDAGRTPGVPGWKFLGVEQASVIWARHVPLPGHPAHRGLFRVLLAATDCCSWRLGGPFARNHAPGSNIHSYGDALWWAVVTVTTSATAPFPVTPAGGRGRDPHACRIGLIGTLTPTVASFFVQDTPMQQGAAAGGPRGPGAQIGDLNARLARIEAALVAAPVRGLSPQPDPPIPQPDRPVPRRPAIHHETGLEVRLCRWT